MQSPLAMAAVFSHHGVPAQLTPAAGGEAIDCRVLLRRDQQVAGAYGEYIGRRDLMYFLIDEVNPARGDTVTIDASDWVVDAIESRDMQSVCCVMRLDRDD